MSYFYELINHQQGSFVNAFIHSVDQIEMHWHGEMEILLVLEGSVNIRSNTGLYLLKENDLILINPNEIHNIFSTQEKNILLAVQINLKNLNAYYPKVDQRLFNCNSTLWKESEQEQLDVIRHYLAEMVWEINKNVKGYEFAIGSYLSLLIRHLVKYFYHSQVENEDVEDMNRDMRRLQNIVGYISEHLDSRITLTEIADREQLSVPYLSRFIKEKMGMSFQQYVSTLRMDKATSMLLTTDKNITDIAYASGFPSSKAFYKTFKDLKGGTPTEFREGMNHSGNNSESMELMEKPSRTYLDVNRSRGLEKIFGHLSLDKAASVSTKVGDITKEFLHMDAQKEGSSYLPYWKKLTNFSRAAEGLRHNLRLQLEELQREIDFEYIRFHGILSGSHLLTTGT